MKKEIILIFLLIPVVMVAANYYITPNGSDVPVGEAI
jgi:hypothetical protein